MKVKKKKKLDSAHTWIASIGAVIGIVVLIWTTLLSERALLVTADYHVEDAELEGFDPIFKRFVFSLKLRNQGDGVIVLQKLILANSVFDAPENLESLSGQEQLEYVKEYWNCKEYTATLPADWVYGKNIAEIEPNQTYEMSIFYDAIEGIGSYGSDVPGSPICLVAIVKDQFGMTHKIAESIGAIKTSKGIRLETGDSAMNYTMKYQDIFYLLPKSKCIEILSRPYCF